METILYQGLKQAYRGGVAGGTSISWPLALTSRHLGCPRRDRRFDNLTYQGSSHWTSCIWGLAGEGRHSLRTEVGTFAFIQYQRCPSLKSSNNLRFEAGTNHS